MSTLPATPAHTDPSFLRRQEPTPILAPSPMHPSPLPGGRLGGGWNAASQRTSRAAPRSPMSRPSPSFLRRQEPSPTFAPSPMHPSPLPEGRLGGGWNAASQRTSRAAPRSSTSRPCPSFLRRQEPSPILAPSPMHPSPLPGGRLGGGWEAAPQHTSRAPLRSPTSHPCPSFLRRQEQRIPERALAQHRAPNGLALPQ